MCYTLLRAVTWSLPGSEDAPSHAGGQGLGEASRAFQLLKPGPTCSFLGCSHAACLHRSQRCPPCIEQLTWTVCNGGTPNFHQCKDGIWSEYLAHCLQRGVLSSSCRTSDAGHAADHDHGWECMVL